MRRSTILLGVLSVASLSIFACLVTTNGPRRGGPRQARAEPTPAAVTPVVDEAGKTYQISQGVRGAPELVGCADGQREAFVDAAQLPTIAVCIVQWCVQLI